MLEVAVVIATGLGALMAGGAYLIRRNLEKRERNTFKYRPAKLATRPGGTEASDYVRQLLKTHSQPELFGAETGTAREPSTPVG